MHILIEDAGLASFSSGKGTVSQSGFGGLVEKELLLGDRLGLIDTDVLVAEIF